MITGRYQERQIDTKVAIEYRSFLAAMSSPVLTKIVLGKLIIIVTVAYIAN